MKRITIRFALGPFAALAVLLGSGSDSAVRAQSWLQEGPAPAHSGLFAEYTQNIPDGPVGGAVEVVVAHPTNANIAWLGAVNGGVFRSDNAAAASPTWTAQTDDQTSLSIGALALDPTDPTHQTLVAGNGHSSAYRRFGGALAGLLRTTDGGSSWTPLTGLAGKNITGVVARGAVIVASAALRNRFDATSQCLVDGIWRSDDFGASFTQISNNVAVTGLPCGKSFDLVADPTDSTRLFTVMTGYGGGVGVFRSVDTGLTWTKISNTAMDDLLWDIPDYWPTNVEIAVGKVGGANANVYVAICGSTVNGVMGLFRSGNAGDSWVQLDNPPYLHNAPSCHIHFSMVADPVDPNVVYLGGDRQGPAAASIGGAGVMGRLLAMDASQPPGSQAHPITNCSVANYLTLPGCNGVPSTTNNSAPHADSRDMVFDANGDILEGDDGGVYRHTDPSGTTGDWVSAIGDLGAVEQHDVAYDSVAGILISGNQDNGTTQQITPASRLWTGVLGGDGGDVAVGENDPVPGESWRYLSAQGFSSALRLRHDAANQQVGSYVLLTLTLLGGDPPTGFSYPAPMVVNADDPTRLLLSAINGVYESMDRLDSITQISSTSANQGLGGGPMAYGVPGNPEVLYYGSSNSVMIRDGNYGNVVYAETPAGTDLITGVVIDPDDANAAFAVDRNQVFRRASPGWNDVTGNLQSLNPGTLYCVEYIAMEGGDRLVVGTDAGVFFATEASGFAIWDKLGAGLPNSPVYELDYGVSDDLLAAGTLGRGAWTLSPTLPIVVNTDDSGPGSLRDMLANGASGQIITFDASLAGQTIDLTSGPLTISRDLSIDASALSSAIRIRPTQPASFRALLVEDNQTAVIQGLTISGGAGDYGGGIRNDGILTLIDSTVSNNVASMQGGGIYNYADTLTLIRVTLIANSAAGQGGAIWAAGSTTYVENSTIYNNQAPYYGGIVNENGVLSLIHSTVVSNHATGFGSVGGGLSHLEFGLASTQIENSIIARNTAVSGADVYKNDGTVSPTGANLIGSNDTVSSEFPSGSLVGTAAFPLDPKLLGLYDYGGPTLTLHPRFNSPVIDAAIATPNSPSTDQRGEPRSFGQGADLGSVEITLVGDHPCCDTGTAGCDDSEIQTAVCVKDPWCCVSGWAAACVQEVTSFAGVSCNACVARSTNSASDDAIRDCVCAVDSFCCDEVWDRFCAEQVETLSCGSCVDQEFVYVNNNGVTENSVTAFAVEPGGGQIPAGFLTPTLFSPYTTGVASNFSANVDSIAASQDPACVFATSAAAGMVSAFERYKGGYLLPVVNYAAGTNPVPVAVDEIQDLVFVGNFTSADISVYSFDGSCVLTPVGTFPLAPANSPLDLEVSSDGARLFVSNDFSGQVSVLDIGAGGASLTHVSGSPFAAGGSQHGLTRSPDESKLYVSDLGGTISGFDVGASGALTPAPGSPFAAGSQPVDALVSTAGNYLIVSDNAGTSLEVFGIAANGSLSAVASVTTDSPSQGPAGLVMNATEKLFNVNGGFASSTNGSATVSVYNLGDAGSLTPIAGSPFDTGVDSQPSGIVIVPQPVPEPAGLTMLFAGCVALLALSQRRRGLGRT